MSKMTQGEQAEQQANAFIDANLKKVEKPPVAIGAEFCTECGDKIPMARRKAYGNG